jgi:hypothetical protein
VKCQIISLAANLAFVNLIGSRFRGKVELNANSKLQPGHLINATIAKIDTHEPPRINLDSAEVCQSQ